jgi:hypothetical protein
MLVQVELVVVVQVVNYQLKLALQELQTLVVAVVADTIP